MLIKRRKFYSDLLINIFASAIPVIVSNIIVYPVIAKVFAPSAYGTITTCIGLLNLVNGIWGSSVAYTCLLDNGCHPGTSFNLLAIINLVLGEILLLILLILTGCIKDVQFIFLGIMQFLLILHNYIGVEYRLKISYKKIMCSNLALSIGEIVGLLLFFKLHSWYFIFLSGYSFQFVFDALVTTLWREHSSSHTGFSQILKCDLSLAVSSSLSGVATYWDKLLLYPYLGASNVAYYHSASLIAKVAPLFSSSIGNVILSYLVRIRTIRKSLLVYGLIALSGIAAIGLYICNLIVPFFINILYPQYLEECLPLIPYTNLSAMLIMVYNFLFPLLMRFCSKSSQIIIQFIRTVPYFFLSIIMISRYGLVGFCFATIISQFTQIIFIIVLIFYALRRDLQ